ncbi:urease accessory protein UreF [Pseudotabrizicola sediminis]|uniref:Urease accessory protein UreF n=1 Tax=Pseudotabrizicola sediminis TaxID=2486418 RepID=A0ABY2KP87_9RHOB|nr:urease accessory UreF family protein [Pseudotabrizicola sediminis]TGD42937.1 urease accessory protein UreF [Pseudotabrizicola sediminis]
MTQDLLSLVQWLSPAFPTGGFAYSHGLESAISSGQVTDAASLRQWLTEVLQFGAGRQDAILLVQALRSDADYGALDDLARALQPSSERLSETLEQGTAFARTVAALTTRVLPARCLPVAVGEAAAPLSLPPAQVAALYLHAFASNLTSIAMRFMPLGQEAGQGVLASLHQVIDALSAEATLLTLEDLASSALGADLSALAHETMDVRIFRT